MRADPATGELGQLRGNTPPCTPSIALLESLILTKMLRARHNALPSEASLSSHATTDSLAPTCSDRERSVAP